jgi:hypothetical protein
LDFEEKGHRTSIEFEWKSEGYDIAVYPEKDGIRDVGTLCKASTFYIVDVLQEGSPWTSYLHVGRTKENVIDSLSTSIIVPLALGQCDHGRLYWDPGCVRRVAESTR